MFVFRNKRNLGFFHAYIRINTISSIAHSLSSHLALHNLYRPHLSSDLMLPSPVSDVIKFCSHTTVALNIPYFLASVSVFLSLTLFNPQVWFFDYFPSSSLLFCLSLCPPPPKAHSPPTQHHQPPNTGLAQQSLTLKTMLPGHLLAYFHPRIKGPHLEETVEVTMTSLELMAHIYFLS